MTELFPQRWSTMPDFIDAEEFPFTRDEIFQAGCRFLPVDEARRMADHLADCAPDLIEARAACRAVWRAAGVPAAETLPLHGWVYPDELLPALASLSADAAMRARQLAEHLWETIRQAKLQGQQRAAAERGGVVPNREEILQRLGPGAKSSGVQRQLKRGLAFSLPPFPPPTPDMKAAADALVAERRRVWNAQVEQFRRERREEGS